MGQSQKTEEELRATLETLEAIAHRRRYHRLAYFQPYPKQLEFLMLGATMRERLLMAANRCGKTEIGAFELACHLTGLYPPWWRGRRFGQSIKAWACGETSQAVRDIVQGKLFGTPGVEEAFGTGMVPKALIVDVSRAHGGIMDALDTVQVRHASGGVSIVSFKSYEQGREKFQGAGLDCIWFDEEPSERIYLEGLTRIGERDGICWMTFTPLLGPTTIVLRYTDQPSPDRVVVGMTLDDIPPPEQGGHLTPEARDRMLAGYSVAERDARARGIPLLGSGRIFLTPEEAIIEARIEHVPAYWYKLWAIDFGIGHPFGAVLLLWDKDNDIVHIHHTIRMSDTISLAHADAMRKVARAVPVAWPADGTNRDLHSGEPISVGYRKHGLNMLHEHAQWAEGGVSTEAGLHEWDEREKTGRLKCAAHLSDWWEERRFYHRKEGKIVKLKDDLMSATRTGLMMLRYAKQVGLGEHVPPRERGGIARGVDFDVFNPRGGGDDFDLFGT